MRRRYRAVMRVVKQQLECARGPAPATKLFDQPCGSPFVDSYDIGIVECAIEIECRLDIAADRDALQQPRRLDHRPIAAIADRVLPAPSIARFVDGDLMAKPYQLARHSAEEMRVAVVPAGGDRVTEENEVHARASR